MSLIKTLYFHTLIIIGLILISFGAETSAQTSVQLLLPTNATGVAGSVVSIPITLTNTNPPQSIASYAIDVAFNSNVLEPIQPTPANTDPAIDRTNTLSVNCGVVVQYTGAPGKFNVSALGCPINGSGTLVKLLFRVIGTAGNTATGTSNLTINRTLLENGNGNAIAAMTMPGMFTITTSPVVNSVKVSGRILTPDNRGLRGAQIKLTTADGSSKTIMSGTSGNYRFADVQTGQLVTIEVSSKRYKFQPQSVNVFGEISDLNFVAQPMSSFSRNK